MFEIHRNFSFFCFKTNLIYKDVLFGFDKYVVIFRRDGRVIDSNMNFRLNFIGDNPKTFSIWKIADDQDNLRRLVDSICTDGLERNILLQNEGN